AKPRALLASEVGEQALHAAGGAGAFGREEEKQRHETLGRARRPVAARRGHHYLQVGLGTGRFSLFPPSANTRTVVFAAVSEFRRRGSGGGDRAGAAAG